MEEDRFGKISEIANYDEGDNFYLSIIKKRGWCIVILSIVLAFSLTANYFLGVKAMKSSKMVRINDDFKLSYIQREASFIPFWMEKAIVNDGNGKLLCLERVCNCLWNIENNLYSIYNDPYEKARYFFYYYRVELKCGLEGIAFNLIEDIPNEEELNNYLIDFKNISNKINSIIDYGDDGLSYGQINLDVVIDQLVKELKNEDVKKLYEDRFE